MAALAPNGLRYPDAPTAARPRAEPAASDFAPVSLSGLRWDGRRLGNVEGLIIHHTGGRGSAEGVVSTLNQRGFGIQYIMDRDGTIYQAAPDDARVSHFRNGQGAGRGLGNHNAIGIEIIARDNDDLTPAQIESGTRFIEAMRTRHPGIGDRVFGHGEVNPHKMATEGAAVIAAWRGNHAPGAAVTAPQDGGAKPSPVAARTPPLPAFREPAATEKSAAGGTGGRKEIVVGADYRPADGMGLYQGRENPFARFTTSLAPSPQATAEQAQAADALPAEDAMTVLARLEGEALEDALARTDDAQRERYLRAG